MSKKEIMIVEDESLVAASLKMLLENQGYRVSGTVTSGEEALGELEKIKPYNGKEIKGHS